MMTSGETVVTAPMTELDVAGSSAAPRDGAGGGAAGAAVGMTAQAAAQLSAMADIAALAAQQQYQQVGSTAGGEEDAVRVAKDNDYPHNEDPSASLGPRSRSLDPRKLSVARRRRSSSRGRGARVDLAVAHAAATVAREAGGGRESEMSSPTVQRMLNSGNGARSGGEDSPAVTLASRPGVKMYRCNEPGCGKHFTRRSNLKVHLRMHTNEEPYACLFPGCGKQYKWRSCLTSHYLAHQKQQAMVQTAAGSGTHAPAIAQQPTANDAPAADEGAGGGAVDALTSAMTATLASTAISTAQPPRMGAPDLVQNSSRRSAQHLGERTAHRMPTPDSEDEDDGADVMRHTRPDVDMDDVEDASQHLRRFSSGTVPPALGRRGLSLNDAEGLSTLSEIAPILLGVSMGSSSASPVAGVPSYNHQHRRQNQHRQEFYNDQRRGDEDRVPMQVIGPPSDLSSLRTTDARLAPLGTRDSSGLPGGMSPPSLPAASELLLLSSSGGRPPFGTGSSSEEAPPR